MGCGIIKNTKNVSKEVENQQIKCQIQNNTPQVNINIITNSTRLITPNKFKIKNNTIHINTSCQPHHNDSSVSDLNTPKNLQFLNDSKTNQEQLDLLTLRKTTQIRRLKSKFKEEQDRIIIEKKSFIHKNEQSIDSFYEIKEKLGTGSFGSVYKVIHKKSAIVRAMKVIKICDIETDSESCNSDSFLMEISVLIDTDHPNIMKLYEYFSDKINYYIIMEYIRGCDLWTYMTKLTVFDEKVISNILKQLLSAVNYLHSKNIVHRDIKPDNIIIKQTKRKMSSFCNNKDLINTNSNNVNDIQLVLIDFGNSNYYQNKNIQMTSLVGTPYYISPDVLKENYTEKCDIWSCGIILYSLLLGHPPFKGKNMKEIFKKILAYEISFDNKIFHSITDSALDLIKKMIEFDSDKRISAEEALKHPFILLSDSNSLIDEKTANDILNNIKNFYVNEKLQQATLSYIVHYNINKDDIGEFERIFKDFDVNGDGRLSINEIKIGFEKLYGKVLSGFELENIINLMDTDKDNFVEYQEFLRVAMNSQMLINESNLRSAFEGFDRDNNGCLDKKEIRLLLGSTVNEEYLNELVGVLDENGDGKVTYDEFAIFMKEIALKKL